MTEPLRKTVNRVASWLVSTNNSPVLLRLALKSILANKPPDDWDHQVIVVGPPGDPGHDVASELLIKYVPCKGPIGKQLTAAMESAAGDLFLVTNDHELQSPDRLWEACHMWGSGAIVTGLRFYFAINLNSGSVARWLGPGDLQFNNYDADALRIIGGWGSCLREPSRHMSHELRKVEFDLDRISCLSSVVSCSSIELVDPSDGRRPFPLPGARTVRGNHLVVGVDREFKTHETAIMEAMTCPSL